MELLEGTLESEFLKTPIKRSLSREGIGKIISTLTDMLERINLEMNLHQTNLTDKFDIIQNQLLNLKADYKGFKEQNAKRWKRMKKIFS